MPPEYICAKGYTLSSKSTVRKGLWASFELMCTQHQVIHSYLLFHST